jgi:hypothetical protein
MDNNHLSALRDLVRKNPSLIWYTKSYDTLETKPIVEAIINYGSWQEFLKLKNILGIAKLAAVFKQLDEQKRNNLIPMYRHFFRHYFIKYAQ